HRPLHLPDRPRRGHPQSHAQGQAGHQRRRCAGHSGRPDRQRLTPPRGGIIMPFIDLRTTVPAAPEQREALKAAFGQAITALHKTETYLMVSIQDNAELWLGGQKLDKGAYVAVSLYGSASSADYNRMTGLVCGILSEH